MNGALGLDQHKWGLYCRFVHVHNKSSLPLVLLFCVRRFLGLLHMEVFLQRLEQEHGASVITTSPTVPYTLEYQDGTRSEIENPTQFPLNVKLAGVWEPTVAATILTPIAYTGAIMQLCQDRRGDMTEHTVLGETRAMLRYGAQFPTSP